MKGTKRFALSSSAADTNDSAFRNKRIMAGSPFEAQRAEPSQQQSTATPPLDPQRAELSRQHVKALNTQFASWVQSQLKNHPDELWEDGVQDYLTHASNIMEKFADVVNWLKANSANGNSLSAAGSHKNESKVVSETKNTENKLIHGKSGFTPMSTSTVFGLGTTIPSFSMGTTTTSFSPGTTTASFSSGTTSSFSLGTTTPSFSPGTTTPSFSPGTTTTSFSPGSTTASFSPGTTTSSFSLGTTTSSFSLGTTTSSFSPGTTTPSFSPGTTTPSFSLGTTTTNPTPPDTTKKSSPVGTTTSFFSASSTASFATAGSNSSFAAAGSNSSFATAGSNLSFATAGSNSSFATAGSNSSFPAAGLNSGFIFGTTATNITSASPTSFTSSGMTTTFANPWSSVSNSQAPVLFGGQSSLAVNNNASDGADDDNELPQPSSPSVQKSEEKGIVVVHEVKCKLYVKSTDPADKDSWKDKGTGQLSIRCKEGISKGSADSKPTVIVRNDVGKVLLNALLYPGIKTSAQKNSLVAIFHTLDEGGDNNNVVARTFLIRTKSAEDRNKLATAIQEYAPAS